MRKTPKLPDAHVPRTGHGPALLIAVNAAAASLQRSAHSEADVFRAFGEQIAGCGLRGSISLLDETGERLIVRSVALPDPLLMIIARLEALTGLKAEGFAFPVAQVDAFRQVFESTGVVFVPDTAAAIAQMLPEGARTLAGILVKAFGDYRPSSRC